jgi:hypothetical protein
MAREVPSFKAANIGFNVAYVLASLLLMVSAIMLFLKMPIGRTACIIGSAIILLITLAYIAHQAAFVLPAQFKWQQQNPAMAAGGGAGLGILKGATYIVLVIAAILYAGYPLLAIGLLMTSSVRRVFSGSAMGPADDFDDRGRDDYDDRRRDPDPGDRRREDDDR